MQRVINFSGGKTSAYMTITEYKEGDIVLFCDTGREHPKTYEFINEFEINENIPVTRISYDGGFEGLLAHSNYKKIPYRMNPFCSIELKTMTARRYMLRTVKIRNYENLIGFRSDETHRILAYRKNKRAILKSVTAMFPLHERGIDKQMINEYWKNKPYTLNIPHILGNCTLCFRKGKHNVMAILREHPEFADVWIEDEKRSAEKFGHTYFKGVTIEQLRNIAQNNLFKDINLDELNAAFDCACTT